MGVVVGSSRVSKRGQITIPQEIRDKFDIKEGDIIYFVIENNKIYIVKGPLKYPIA